MPWQDSRNAAPMVVVIIDDSPTDAADMKAALLNGSTQRFKFHAATTGEEGLELLQRLAAASSPPACLLLDFNLPDMNAYDVITALRRADGQLAMPIVVVTGNDRIEESRAMIAAGAQDVIGKSWLSAASLTRAVENAVERHALLDRVKRSEAAAREGERRYRELVETMGEGLCLVDRHRKIELTNRAFDGMMGYETGELTGVHTDSIRPAAPADGAGEWLNAAPDGRDTRTVEDHRLRRKDGRELWVTAASVALKDERGEVRGMLSIVTDVSEKRELELRLQQAQKLESLGVLAGGIAHDFNNLLVGVLGNAGLALMDLPLDSVARADLETIETAAVRASELTKQLLAYAGKGRFVIGEIELGPLVAEMGSLLTASIPRDVVLQYQLMPDLPTIEGDATQLRQVVMNLITNAAEAIRDMPSCAGVITVSTGVVHADRAYLAATLLDESLEPGEYVTLEVADTGAGMSPETRSKIFDPFFSTKFTGRGLGLAAVLGIMRAHKGAIRVDSELGRGTTFKVMLPAFRGAAPPVRRTSTPEREWRGSGKILVVDDEPMVRKVASRILESAGLQVLTAGDGIDALEVFSAHRDEIRAVLLDVTMPRMGGEETFRRLRLLAPDVRVLLSSGYSEDEATSRFAGAGLAGFIGKPFSPQALLDRLREVVDLDV
jgi:PAS domain S-box-containing protein